MNIGTANKKLPDVVKCHCCGSMEERLPFNAQIPTNRPFRVDYKREVKWADMPSDYNGPYRLGMCKGCVVAFGGSHGYIDIEY